jgi:hypothetical protein
MNPIPTTNAMKPAPGKGVSSFPTPVIKDTVIVEVVNAWKGDYQPLEYGTEWDSVPHASVQGSFPGHKLVNQSPNSEDGQWVKRIWANDRVDQDTYNYAIKYSGGSDAHPIYIRTYVELRETYAPVPDLSPDPLFPGAFLVEEEVQREDSELDSKYVKVIRTYETLPGPIISSKRYNERGDLETVETQQVFPSALPDPDGLLVTQSQVIKEDVSKGTKTTATVPSHSLLFGRDKKSGLLANTSIQDSIVSPATQPDNLTFTGAGGVVESSVQPISATKSKKVTVTSFGPTKLDADSLVDSPLGLVEANSEKSIVAPQTQPTSNPNEGLTVIKDSFEKLDDVKVQREKVRVLGWPTNTGVDYDEQLGIGIYYTETIVSPNEYINPNTWEDLSNIDYKPIDQWKSLKRTTNKSKIAEALLSQWYKISTDVDVSLPDKLIDVIVYWGSSYAAGQSAENSFGSYTGSYSASLSSSSKRSASINGDIYFNIEQGFKGAIPGFQHIFFIEIGENGKITDSDILDILNNFEQFGQRNPPQSGGGESVISLEKKYKRWPYIQSRSENIVVITGGKAETTNISSTQSVSINGFGGGSGTGSSFDVDVNARSVNVPQTLHKKIEIKEEIFGDITPVELGPIYGVRPKELAVTKVRINGEEKDAETFPIGEYLYSSNVELYKWGFAKVSAITVNITSEYV